MGVDGGLDKRLSLADTSSMVADFSDVLRRGGLNFVKGAFFVALALLLVLVLRSIAVQITPPPAPLTEPYPDVSTEELCADAGGRWVESSAAARGGEPVPVRVPEGEFQPYCQGPLAFERERMAQDEASKQTSLFVFAVGGALAVAGSLLVSQLRAVAPGLMLGGVVSFIIAGFHVWTLAPGIGRLITIVVVFAVLVGVGMRVFREPGK